MPALMQLPSYNPGNALIDWSPLNQGIQTWRKGMEDNQNYLTAQKVGEDVRNKNWNGAMSNALMGDRSDLAQLAMHGASQESTLASAALERESSMAKLYGGVAQRALDSKDPAIAASTWERMKASHPEFTNRLAQYGIDPNDAGAGLNFVMAQAAGYRDPLEQKFKQAQIANLYASANARNALAAQRSPVEAAPVDPLDGYGLDGDGNMIRLAPGSGSLPPSIPMPPRQSQVPMTPTGQRTAAAGPLSQTNALLLGGGAEAMRLPVPTADAGYDAGTARFATPGIGAPQAFPSAASMVLGAEANDDLSSTSRSPMIGPVGRVNSTVPGVVVDAKGRTDQYGSKLLAGQEAMADRDPEARQRLSEYLRNQQLWQLANGKAPSGFVYNADGSLRDLKDESKKAVSRDKVASLMDDIKTANSILQKTNVAERGLAHATSGWVSPDAEQAARAVEHVVQFMTAEIEGKRHANAQDVRMLRFFAPQWSDSGEMIGFKLDQLNRIMSGYFGAKVPSGALFQSVMSKARANLDKAVKEGRIPAPSAMVRSPPEQTGGKMPYYVPDTQSQAATDLTRLSTEDLLKRLNNGN